MYMSLTPRLLHLLQNDEGKFYSEAGAILLNAYSNHLWCEKTELMRKMLPCFDLYDSNDIVRGVIELMEKQMNCVQCVSQYINARKIFLLGAVSRFTEESIHAFSSKLNARDVVRLTKSLTEHQTSNAPMCEVKQTAGNYLKPNMYSYILLLHFIRYL